MEEGGVTVRELEAVEATEVWPRWRAARYGGRSLPQRKQMTPANTATSMMTKGSFELVSSIRS